MQLTCVNTTLTSIQEATSESNASNIKVKLLRGVQIKSASLDISRLWGSIYREPPYFYQQGGPEDDAKYIREMYEDNPQRVVCIAYHGKKIIGAASGVPLNCASEQYQKAFHAYPPKEQRRIFYFGEWVVRREYRKQKVGKALYEMMENHVIASGSYKAICVATIDWKKDRSLNHMMPADYTSTDPLWEKLGFKERRDLKAQSSWTVVGDTKETTHPMSIRMKKFAIPL